MDIDEERTSSVPFMAHEREVYSSTIVGREIQKKRFLRHRTSVAWPPPSDIHCFNDRAAFDSEPVPLPIAYNEHTRQYTLDGAVFCGFACAKAYALRTFVYNHSLPCMLLSQMARDVYGIHQPIEAADDVECLRTLGGDRTILEYRNRNPQLITRLLQYPFVTRDALLETVDRSAPRSRSSDAIMDTLLRRAQAAGEPCREQGEIRTGPSRYAQYVAQRKRAPEPSTTKKAPAVRKKVVAPKRVEQRTLARFFKTPEDSD